jgi:hypothetical protein
LSDSLEVSIDGQQVLSTSIGYRRGDKSIFSAHSHSIIIDDTPVELQWRWHWLFRGDPAYILLRHGSQVLVKYGSERTIAKVEVPNGLSLDQANDIIALRLLDDNVTSDQLEEIDREDFPLDNRFGSNDLSVEQEISRSVNSTVSVTNRAQIEAQLKADVFSVIQAQLTSHLERAISQTMGETITRRQKVAFSVKAGQSVLYTILWKARRRTGKCLLSAGNEAYPLLYAVRYGLSFEITSSNAPGLQPANSGSLYSTITSIQ